MLRLEYFSIIWIIILILLILLNFPWWWPLSLFERFWKLHSTDLCYLVNIAQTIRRYHTNFFLLYYILLILILHVLRRSTITSIIIILIWAISLVWLLTWNTGKTVITSYSNFRFCKWSLILILFMNFCFLFINPFRSFLLWIKFFWNHCCRNFLPDRLRRLIIIFKISISIWIPRWTCIFITFQKSWYFNFRLLKLLIQLTLFFMCNILLSLCKFSIIRNRNFRIKICLMRILHIFLLRRIILIIYIILMMHHRVAIVILSQCLFWFSNQCRLFSFFTNHFSSF